MKYFFFICGCLAILAGVFSTFFPGTLNLKELYSNDINIIVDFFGLVFIGISVILDKLQEHEKS